MIANARNGAGPSAQSNPDPAKGGRIANLALLAGSLLIGALIMEVGVRIFRPQKPSWIAVFALHPVLEYFHIPNHEDRVDTGEAQWTVYTDDQGFRVGKEHGRTSGKPPALWLGDSYTFGYGVSYEESFVGRLDMDKRSRLHHINGAVVGFGPIQYRKELEYLLVRGLKPKELFVATFLGNDFQDCVWDKKIPINNGIMGDTGGPISALKERSHLYRLISNIYHSHANVKTNFFVHEQEMSQPAKWQSGLLADALKVYKEELAKIQLLCKQHDIALTVVVIPMRSTVEAVAGKAAPVPGIPDANPDLPRKHALSILESLEIRTVDLTPALAEHLSEGLFFPIDTHLTPRGSEVVEQAILRARPDLLEPSPG